MIKLTKDNDLVFLLSPLQVGQDMAYLRWSKSESNCQPIGAVELNPEQNLTI